MIRTMEEGPDKKALPAATEDTLTRIRNLSERNIENLEKSLCKSDLCSLIFLLRDRDDDGIVLKDLEFNLLTDEVTTSNKFWPSRSTDLLVQWIKSVADPNWRIKIVEALLVTQNFGALKTLQFDVDNLKNTFEPSSKWHSVHLNHLRKLLYLFVDDLDDIDWKQLSSAVNFEQALPWSELRKGALEFPEICMLYWSSKRIINIKTTKDVNISAILKNLPKLNRDDWVRILSGACEDRISSPNEMSSEPLTVTSPQKTTIPNNSQDRYKINRGDAGVCLIFNQEHVVGFDEPRDGTRKDAEYLEQTFKCFGFQVHTRHDLSAEEMARLICYYGAVNRNMDCFIVAILSHGERDVVKDKHGKNISIDKIQDTLLRINTIIEKPKLLLIQACQANRSYFVNHLCDTLLENPQGIEWMDVVRICNAKMEQEKFANLMAWHKCAFTKRLIFEAKSEAAAEELLQKEKKKREQYLQQHS